MNRDHGPIDEDARVLLAGGGEMGERIRGFDWAGTPLGPVSQWPQSLKTVVRVMLDSRYAMWLGWGPDLTFFYNDAYAAMTLGPKHPWALGRPARSVWSEIWADIGPRAESVVRSGQATWDEGLLLFLERRGFAEETYHTFSYSPVPDDRGDVGGMLCVVTEDTQRTIGERRLRTLRALAARGGEAANSVGEACQAAGHTLADNPHDLPFVLLYLLDERGHATLCGHTGLEKGTAASPARIELERDDSLWPLRRVLETGEAVVVSGLPATLGPLPGGAWSESPEQAIVLPMARHGHSGLAGFIVAGLSPRLALDDDYRGFLELLAGQVATDVANARAYEEEKRRALALAELDRVKTAFFSNVSHEFRTPLTLMLGPVEDMLSRSHTELSPAAATQLGLVHRNGQRLLRLVNTLLDFSRIEAGRIRATFRPTDLAAVTADLASGFRSACERAGLQLVVQCPPLGQAVYVDRDMWEKTVLNLLSNAFKFTFEGRITVTLKQVGEAVELRVRDTGIGIPAEELPRVFERFHRVQSARGRTHEGSGIGLALVRELVALHGGSITAESELGQGTCFIVTVPLGAWHLPAEQIGAVEEAPRSSQASAVVEEATRWLPDGDAAARPKSEPVEGRPRVLVADDNADMRKYVVRLLAEYYEVEAVGDGEEALAAAGRQIPALVVTDVMMPRLDGFGLMRALRADPRTRGVPIVMLSARAGEESRVEGIAAGADDYLVKPFGARELLARVSSLLKMAKIRKAGEERVTGILESITDGFVVFDAEMRCTYVNAEAERLLGMSREEFVGRTPWDKFPGYLETSAAREIRRVMLERVSAEVETYYEPWSRWFTLRVFPTQDGGVSTYFRDITDRKRAEDALREADRRKDEFLAILAHELRNPLAPLYNGLQVMKLLRNEGQAVEQARVMMERQLGQMVRLIDDLMDVSRISRGKIDLRKERIELTSVVHAAIETSRPLIEASGHALTVSLPGEPIYLQADAIRLTQVLANLLNNAAKYTERQGKIALTVKRRGDEVEIGVLDSGIGIPTEMLPRVFELFTQINRSLGRAQGGLGIGLSLVRALVELHGGTVEAVSEGHGRGSEFVIRLPCLRSEQEPVSQVEASVTPRGPRRRVLVVDDNQDAATSLAMLLTLMGNDARIAHGGMEALEIGPLFRPDVVLLDIGMPTMDGYETARRIRALPWGREAVLVAQTGWGQEGDKRRSQVAGFDVHLVKPVDAAAIQKLMAGLVTREAVP